MRITFAVDSLQRGGSQGTLADLTNLLSRRGHDVTILMPAAGQVDYDLRHPLVRIGRDRLEPHDYPLSDLIVSTHCSTVKSSQSAVECLGIPHIRYSLCYEPLELPGHPDQYTSYQATSRLIVVSEWQRQLMHTLYGVEGIVVPSGIHPMFDNFHNRERLSRITVSAFARAQENVADAQNQPYLLEQLGLLKQSHPELDVHLICMPNEYAASPALQQLSSSGMFRVIVPSNDIELCYCYNQAHIFVTPSSFEMVASAGMEAMKCGAALVAVHSGGNSDYCRHGVNGLISTFHENRLREHIVCLVNDPRLRKRLARQGEKDAREWTRERTADLFEQAVRTLTAEAGLKPRKTGRILSFLSGRPFK
ncbi:glycosyltransferase family 4 protein [Cohnella suwonensis]|uniref:Glycosyltransferase family 4 protein n=1 Tax=Cohnella suwonensis TaxID=696072 RepID=A0ABW0LW76_9BACL